MLSNQNSNSVSWLILELLSIMCDEDRVAYFHDVEENIISTYCKG